MLTAYGRDGQKNEGLGFMVAFDFSWDVYGLLGCVQSFCTWRMGFTLFLCWVHVLSADYLQHPWWCWVRALSIHPLCTVALNSSREVLVPSMALRTWASKLVYVPPASPQLPARHSHLPGLLDHKRDQCAWTSCTCGASQGLELTGQTPAVHTDGPRFNSWWQLHESCSPIWNPRQPLLFCAEGIEPEGLTIRVMILICFILICKSLYVVLICKLM